MRNSFQALHHGTQCKIGNCVISSQSDRVASAVINVTLRHSAAQRSDIQGVGGLGVGSEWGVGGEWVGTERGVGGGEWGVGGH